MIKKVGSKLANSVRQAKEKQPKVSVTQAVKAASVPADVVVEPQTASSIVLSKRVWPD